MERVGTFNQYVVEMARTWIGTPYHHQAAKKGIGCDCIGLVRGVWIDLYGAAPEDFVLPVYTPFWAEETGQPLMTSICLQYLQPIVLGAQLVGDVLLYRMTSKGPTKHAGILSAEKKLIHAYSGHAVAETALIANRYSAITHVFRYPAQV